MVMDRLSRGESRDVIQRDLELSRPDKPRPAFYAQLTLDKAVRELQLRGVVASIQKSSVKRTFLQFLKRRLVCLLSK